MKIPFKNLSARSTRILYSAAVLLVLFATVADFLQVMVYNVTSNDQCAWRSIPDKPDRMLITDVVPGGVAEKAGIKNNDILLKIDGKSFLGNAAQYLIDAHGPGEFATYLIERNGVQFETRVEILKLFNITYLAEFLLGLGFLIVGYIVVMTKPLGEIQRLFGRYGLFCMLTFGIQGIYVGAPGILLWMLILQIAGFFIARVFAPKVFLSFFLHFPVRRKILQRKWLNPAIYGVSLLSLLLLIFRNRLGWLLPDNLLITAAFTPHAFYLAGLVVFTHSYFTLVEPSKRKQLRQILIAGAIGIVTITYVLVLIAINPFVIFLQPTYMLPVVFMVFVPFAFGYAIFHYRLMDIELLIKRSLIYGTVTTSLAAIYVVLVFGIGSLLGIFLGHSENRILSIVALIIIAFVFDPVKRRAQDSIDRIFYRERYNYQKALLEFSQELPRLMNLEQILNSIVHRISSTMHIEKVAVVLCEEHEGCLCVTQNIPQEYCQFIEGHQGLIALLKETRAPQSFALLAEEPESVKLDQADREKIVHSGIVLAVPMFIQERLIGTINVGQKLSGKIYSQEDIDLLSTVASQAAVAIENARLHQSEIEKQKIQEELELARRIQQGLLPKSDPVVEGLEIAGISLPALTVGGDYFDYIQLTPRKLLVVVADVSGKGMSASLYMSKVQGMVQLAARMYDSPKEILIHVNRLLYDGMERKSFITMILALFDMEKRELRICRAGHNKAIIQSNGQLRHLNAKGIGLGLERGPLFETELEEIRLPLQAKRVYVFYTDGLTEAMNEQRKELGEETVLKIVETESTHAARDIQRELVRAAKEFQGSAEQHDDLTLVVVKTM